MIRNARGRIAASVIVMLLGPAILYGNQSKTTVDALRKSAWEILWRGAHSSERVERSAAIRALGLLNDSPVVVRLAEQALQDKDPGVREAGAISLGEMHASSSIPKLKKALSDSDIAVALAAAHSLLMLGQPAGYDAYYAVLTGKRKSGQSLLGQQLAQFNNPRKMAEFAFDQGIDFLPYAGYGMEVIQALTKEQDGPILAAAARVLAKDPDPRTGIALAKACSDDNWIVQVAALRAVAVRGNPALLSDIMGAMRDDNSTVRYAAAAAVLHLASIKSIREKRSESAAGTYVSIIPISQHVISLAGARR